MADPVMLIAAVRAALRIYQSGDNALSQKLRDEEVVFPLNPAVFFTSLHSVASLQADFEPADAPFRKWITARGQEATFQAMLDGDKKAHFAIVQSMKAHEASKKPDSHPGLSMLRAEYTAISQWAKDDANSPVSPLTRFALVLADVAAEFVALNPGLLARGGRGEKLLGSFAGQIEAMIPNDEKFGPQHRLGSRLLGVVFRAGLETASEHNALFAKEDHQQQLVDALIGPVLSEIPDDLKLPDELEWQEVLDTFAGQAMSAAFGVIAENQQAFLGRDFANDALLGALNFQLLTHLRGRGVQDAFTKDGIVDLYRAALGVIAEKPQLVISGGSTSKDFVQSLVRGFAKTLSDEQLIAKGDREDYGLALSIVALEAFRGHADGLLGLGDNPLEQIVSDRLRDVLEALTEGMASGGKRLDDIFGKEKVLELVRDVMGALAENPELLGGSEELKLVVTALGEAVTADNIGKTFAAGLMKSVLTELARNPKLANSHEEVAGILNSLAAAVSIDKPKLLTEEDWKSILATALRQAAQNPGRLFGLTPGNPDTEIAVVAIRTLLQGAASGFNGNRAQGGILFGETLKQAIEATLSTIASNPARAAQIFGIENEVNQIAVFINQISAVVRLKPDGVHFNMGSKEWLRIYRAILIRLLAEMDVPALLEDDGKTLTSDGQELIDDILTTFVPIGN